MKGRAVLDPEERWASTLARPALKDLGGRTARGIAWNVGANALGYVLRLGSIPVLARLLSPDDYGLVAIVTAVTGLVAVVGTLGVSESVIQQRVLTHAQASTLFWVNVAAGAVLTGATIACAPLLAAAFGRPEIAGIAMVTSVSFLVASVGVQHQALMLRQLRHRQVALRNLGAVAVGLAVSVVLAVAGAGYWALVAQTLVQVALSVVLAWVAVPWRPGAPRRRAGVRKMLSFGGGVSTFQVLNYLGRNADNLVIGAFVGAPQLGLYTRAYSLLTAPLQQIHKPVSVVVRPTLAALYTDPPAYRRQFVGVLSGLCYVCMPLVVVLAVLADDVVAVMLGPQWGQSADVFRWLAIVGFLQVVGYTNGWLYASSGRAWAWARWGLISRPVVIASFFVGVPWGIEGVAASYAAAELILTPLGIWRAGRGTPISLRHVVATVWKPGVMAAAMGVSAAGSALLVSGGAAGLAAGLAGAAVSGLVIAVLWRAVRVELLNLWSHARRRDSKGGIAAGR